MINVLFVGGPAHGSVLAVDPDTSGYVVREYLNSTADEQEHRDVLYTRRRWAGEPDGKPVAVDLMVRGDLTPDKVAGAMAMAWMREHGRAAG